MFQKESLISWFVLGFVLLVFSNAHAQRNLSPLPVIGVCSCQPNERKALRIYAKTEAIQELLQNPHMYLPSQERFFPDLLACEEWLEGTAVNGDSCFAYCESRILGYVRASLSRHSRETLANFKDLLFFKAFGACSFKRNPIKVFSPTELQGDRTFVSHFPFPDVQMQVQMDPKKVRGEIQKIFSTSFSAEELHQKLQHYLGQKHLPETLVGLTAALGVAVYVYYEKQTAVVGLFCSMVIQTMENFEKGLKSQTLTFDDLRIHQTSKDILIQKKGKAEISLDELLWLHS